MDDLIFLPETNYKDEVVQGFKRGYQVTEKMPKEGDTVLLNTGLLAKIFYSENAKVLGEFKLATLTNSLGTSTIVFRNSLKVATRTRIVLEEKTIDSIYLRQYYVEADYAPGDILVVTEEGYEDKGVEKGDKFTVTDVYFDGFAQALRFSTEEGASFWGERLTKEEQPFWKPKFMVLKPCDFMEEPNKVVIMKKEDKNI